MKSRHAWSVTASLLMSLLFPALTLAHPGEHADGNADHANNPATVTPTQKSTATIVVRDGYRYITSNGIPNHKTGAFPNKDNPNRISAQKQSFRVTTTPKPADAAAGNHNANHNANNNANHRRPGPPALFGVAINGIVFDPGTAEIWRSGKLVRGGPPQANDWRYEGIGPNGPTLGLDANNAHVQPQGTYHYHGVPAGLISELEHVNKIDHDKPATMLLVGWAADGYPIYAPWAHKDAGDAKSELVNMKSSYQLKPGNRPAGGPPGAYDGTFTDDWTFDKNSGDLDEHNGRTGVTPEFPESTYYYILTQTFPFVPRSHYGTPDSSFQKQGGGGPGGQGAGPGDQGGAGGPGDEGNQRRPQRPNRPERRR